MPRDVGSNEAQRAAAHLSNVIPFPARPAGSSVSAARSSVHGADSGPGRGTTRASNVISFEEPVQVSRTIVDSVRRVASSYRSFDEALLPMVYASGLAGEAAAAVVSAIRNNDGLRAQAERAYRQSQA